MRIGGFQPCSFIDFPGRLAAVVFTQGCNFRCPFCHNAALLPVRRCELFGEERIFGLLAKRRGKLDGVVVSGGEPTLQSDLPDFLRRVRALGFAVKLDTNGSSPGILAHLLEAGLLDYVAMDVKTRLADCAAWVGPAADAETLRRSIAMIVGSGVDHEFRTTVVPTVHDEAVLEDIAAELQGAQRWYLQALQTEHMLDPDCDRAAPAEDWLERVATSVSDRLLPCHKR